MKTGPKLSHIFAFFKTKKIQLLLIVTVIIILAGAIYLYFLLKDLPSPKKLISYDIPQTTKIYDRNDKLLYEIYTDQNRSLVKLKEVPIYLIHATVAVEDKDFYKHQGVSLFGGILRALKETVLHQKLQGGSTITQQLVKNALLTPQRTLSRKFKEIILAFWTEKLYNKDQILEMYLNQVAYGGTSWGVEVAAETYFGKNVKDLTLAEAALLAGLPSAPTVYSPFGAHPEYSKNRQQEVLNRMVQEGYITRDDYQKADAQPLNYRPQQNNIKAPHFVMYVKEKLVEKYGEKLVEQGGLRVKTTLDLDLEEYAQQTVASEVAKLKSLRVSNGAAVISRPTTGEILAMVGSNDYFASQSGNFNVTTSLRQPGSSFKPINYAVGLELKKVTPATLFLDIPTCFGVAGQKSYCPVNYDRKFHGPVQLRFALGNSFNIPAVKMMALNGVETVIASASAMGISTLKDTSKYGLSLTLGGGEVTMLDMATAFGVFANTGIRKDLVSILKIEDRNGKILEEYKDNNFVQEIGKPLSYPSSLLIQGPRVLSTETSYLISHILLDNNARTDAFSTNSLLVVPNHAVSVKTGTTDEKRDNWTIGYTPNFLAVVWVGNNDNTPMNQYLASGVTGAAPIWNKLIARTLKNQPDLWPRQPAGVIGANICTPSGKAPPNGYDAGDKGCATRYEYFIKDTLPKDPEVLKQTIMIDKSSNKQAPDGQTDNVEPKEHNVVSDMFTKYCLDCAHDEHDPVTNIKL